MSERKLSSREKIVKSALSLFSKQGITATTTKEIAENAGVNEVTLFRQFGSKQGLLLSVLQEAPLLSAMQVALSDISGANDPVSAYGAAGLELLGQVPELVRSLIGESGDSPPENRQALGQALRQANQQTIGYLQGAQVSVPDLPVDAIARLLNTLLVGYAVLEASSGEASIWHSQSDFLAAVNRLFSARSADASLATTETLPDDGQGADKVADLPAEVVRSLFQKAKKTGPQAYALVFVLFGAGLRLEECAGLMRSQVFASKTQHVLTLTGRWPRQVPVNRWIMGYRYGTYAKNPLTQWLKARPDERPEVFLSEAGAPLNAAALKALWYTLTEGSTPLTGQPATPFQARQTWCIELLMKGINLETLSILSGVGLKALAPYAQRAKEKAALEAALKIDQKGG
ncbi:MAG: TetR family transcriptional regulator [Cyanobacteria bacterium J06606_4]